MKTGGLVVILVVVAIMLAGGIYLLVQNRSPETANNGNIPDTSAGGTFPEGTGTQTREVNIQSFAFSPQELTVQVGDTVRWTNKDLVSHAITSDSGSELDSPLFGKDGTYSHTFSTVGTYTYHCSVHPSMKGTIIVE